MSSHLCSRLQISQVFRVYPTLRLAKFYSGGRVESAKFAGQTQMNGSKSTIGMQEPVWAGVATKRAITRRRIDATKDSIPETRLASVMAACTAKMYDMPRLCKFMKEKYSTV